ncbi:MAG: M23 family metallopeptidase, partial [Acidobacteriota bacterium]
MACTVLILGEFFLTTPVGSAFAASAFADLDEGGAPEHLLIASSTIPREAIEGFLFRISDRVKDEVLALDGTVIRELPIPILFDVLPEDLEDSWGVSRPGGRIHEGIDILSERGAIVVSPTDAVVTDRGFDPSGGNYCITANPGGEQFYYAHLDSIRDTVEPGAHLKVGDIIGSVGNTGNAEDRAPHLHFGIYYRGSAVYPNPRLTHAFSLQQKADILERTLETG